MLANGASELRQLSHFHILKLHAISFNIWLVYLRYFVGTNGLSAYNHVPTNFEMYRQNSEKALSGGGGAIAPLHPPPPPPLSDYANPLIPQSLSFDIHLPLNRPICQ